jgi:DNA-binding CsgD family transcriptional regulator
MQVPLVGRASLVDSVFRRVADDRRGALLVGEAGVGKSRLLSEILDRLDEGGFHTERFAATAATRGVPFGALLSLLPPTGGDHAQLIAGVRRRLAESAGERPVAFGIDDANQLDPIAMACVVDLVHNSDVAVLMTARADEEIVADLTQLWSANLVDRLEVEPLGFADTVELGGAILGAALHADLGDELWSLTRGVPLFVRELLLDAVSTGAVRPAAGSWRAFAPLRSGSRVQELVGARVAALDPECAALLELLAVAEPLPIAVLRDDEGPSLDRLERRGLARVVRDGSGWSVRVDHPIVTEAIRSALPTRRRVAHLVDAGQRIIEAGYPMRGDALRAARWLSAAGETVGADLAIAAGHDAVTVLDLEFAAELARAACDAKPFEGHYLLGEVLRLQANAVDAEAALAVAAELAPDDDTTVRIALRRSTLMAHHAIDVPGAIELLDAAAERVGDPDRVIELTSEAAFLAGILGDFHTTLRINAKILEHPDLDPSSEWTALNNILFAQVMLARFEASDRAIEASERLVEVVGAERQEGVDLLWALVIAVGYARGEFTATQDRFVAHVQARASQDQMFGFTATVLVQLLLATASDDLIPITEAAQATLQTYDPFLIRPITQSAAVGAYALVGRTEDAIAAFGEIPTSALDDIRIATYVERAEALVHAIRGDHARAVEIAAATGRRAIAESYVLHGIMALSDAVCFGGADEVVGDMTAAAASTRDAVHLVRLAGQARAVADHDGPTLLALADAFATTGAVVPSLLALADAAAAFGDDEHGCRAATRAVLGGLGSRIHAHRPESVTAHALSRRELDVVEGVIAGCSSRVIAERLFLSVRTVENHLARSYRKLGVHGRDDLREVLGLPTDAAPG